MSKKPTLGGAGSADSMSNRMWGGRFTAAPSALMERINVSVGFDKRLYTQDIAGSKAHARMLGDVGILSADDVEAHAYGRCTGPRLAFRPFDVHQRRRVGGCRSGVGRGATSP